MADPGEESAGPFPDDRLPRRLRSLGGALPVLLVVFAAEWLLMHSLERAFPVGTPHWFVDFTDAALITVIMALAGWTLFVRPLRVELLRQSNRARAILSSANEGVVTIDAQGRIDSVNPSAESMFRYESGELVGVNIAVLMPAETGMEHDAHLARYLRTGEKRVIGRPTEVIGQRKDGSRFPIELNVTEIPGGAKPHFAGIMRDITERRAAEQQIRDLAHNDLLTGLPNRALLIERMELAASLARREHHPMAVLYLDLDGFKVVNDTLGHNAGDELLRTTAARMRAQVRESDTVARFGGDEFIVLLPRIAAPQDAEEVARKLIDAICVPYCLGSEQREVRIGVSIGIALFPEDGVELDELLKAGDRAMYRAKRHGNTFRYSGKPDPI